jgi:hypothetical protein
MISVMNFPTMVKQAPEDSSEGSDDIESSPDSSSTKDTDTGEQVNDKSKEQDEIGGQESVGVSRWRRMVILMLLLTAALVITSTYMFLSREETDEFEKSVSLMLGVQQAMLFDHTHPGGLSPARDLSHILLTL